MTPTSPIEQSEEEDVLGYTSSDTSGADEHDLFTEIMERVRLDRVAKYATTIRQSLQHSNPQSTRVIEIKPPIFGSYHVLYPVRFHDEALWLLKVPANGTREKFRTSDARAIRSEALTMRLLRRETTIPVPDVYAFSDTCDNELNFWFDNASPKDIVQARRTRCLRDLAAAMAQLDRFSFSTGGSMAFDDQGYPSGIGPLRLVDTATMRERLRARDPDQSTVYLEMGPFSKTKEYYTALLDHRRQPDMTFEKGVLGLLRLFIDCIPEPSDERGTFVLAHPDLDVQNVLVSRDGALQAIIDWDGVGAVPRSVGNERYPSWLTRDYDPATYCWTEDIERRAEPLGLWEDSPDTLRFYRSLYAGFIQSHQLDDGPACANLTTKSLILGNLLNAANDSYGTVDTVHKIFNAVVKLAREGASTRSHVLDDGKNNRQNGASAKVSRKEKLTIVSNRLLRKVDFYNYKSDGGHREHEVRQRYYLQNDLDYKKYNALCGSLRQLAHKLSQLDPDSDPIRKKVESEVLDKLWRMGILKQSREQGAGLSRVEREVTVSAFCRRRLAVIMARSGMVENVKTAVTFIEQGHVRVGSEVVTDPAYLVTRNMEDFVTWVDNSKIKRNIMQYRDKLDDFDML
ncbi:hypothetical protein G4B11_011072 [Aspergillus flavus]|nr:hypothetical protein G4B11_011072 [Aspergillus flavus]